MKLLVSTCEKQGARPTDFNFVPEGELVIFGEVCHGEDDADGPCGCARALTGVACLKGTTTVKVVERPEFDRDLLWTVVDQAQAKAGIKAVMTTPSQLEMYRRDIDDQVEELMRAADAFSEGAVLEFRGFEFTRRD